ncbi:MAG: LysR family transcriptional regulator [Tateyamaria sp.]|uniref:LysR family transcriptional regulator n=1 Tax=Pseudomonadota TaxID=1224 RepID=UPI003281BC9B
MNQLDAMRSFVRVVQTESFQGAAKLEGVAQGTISKRISALEDHLGTQLLRRNQRGLSLTDLGAGYFKTCLKLLEDFDTAEAALRTDIGVPAGRLRMSMSPVLSRLIIAPLLVEFGREYPKIEIVSFLTEAHTDIVGEGIDLAIRARHLDDSSLKAALISSNLLSVAASPSYLASSDPIEDPEDLQSHNCVSFSRMRAGGTWGFKKEKAKREVKIHSNLAADQGDTLVEYAANGAGIVMMPEWVMAKELADGRLVKILEDWDAPSIPLYIVYSASGAIPLRVRLLVDFLRRSIRTGNLLPR